MTVARKRGVAVGAAVVVSAVTLAFAAPAMAGSGHALRQTAPPRARLAVAGAHYIRVTPACTPAKSGIACYAMIRKTVTLRVGQPVPAGVQRQTLRSSTFPSGAAGGYSPRELQTLYNFSRDGGSGQTVAVVLWYNDPKIRHDLNAFDEKYKFPPETASSFKVINEYGRTSPLPSTNAGTDGADVEESLDVEAVRAACSLCHIVLVEAKSPSNQHLDNAENAAVAAGADIVSNSWGYPEYDPSSGLPTFSSTDARAFNHPGVAILAGTGDDGWYDWDFSNSYDGTSKTTPPSGAASFPSTLPTVVAVGGTAVLSQSGTRFEGVWNEHGSDDREGTTDISNGATGGGCSQVEPAKGWQAHASGYASTGCGGARLAADISAIADPDLGFDIYDTDSQPGWLTIGGTSLASPFVAGMWARAGGPKGVPYPAVTLYANYNKHRATLHDVTQGLDVQDGLLSRGGNNFCGGDDPSTCASTVGGNPNADYPFGARLDCDWDASGNLLSAVNQCNAARGFDGPSGVGTPNGLGVFKEAAFAIHLTHPRRIVAHKSGRYTISLTDPAPGGKLKSAKIVWGDGKTSTTTGGSVSHTYKKTGKYKVAVTVTDNYGVVQVAKYTLTVVR